MHDLIPIDYESSWFDTFAYEEDGSYDDSYYLTYDHVDDRTWCKTNRDYEENGDPGSSWLGDHLGSPLAYNGDGENQYWFGVDLDHTFFFAY